MPQKAKKLWKLDRSGKSEAAKAASEAVGPGDGNLQTVGTTLRLRREERGEELRYVAQMLRIRYPYLKAIEDGLIDELPGPTYAVGFVRTYAEHLGLDTEKTVARFKAEVEGLNARADLHFPAPLPEGKIPSGAIMLVAVVLAGMVYGAWIYLSSKDEQVAEIVPQLPNRISEIIKGKPSESPSGGPVATAPPAAADAAPKDVKKPAAAVPETAVTTPQVERAPSPPVPSVLGAGSDASLPKPKTAVAETPPAVPAPSAPEQPAAATPPPAAPASAVDTEQQIAAINPTREAPATTGTEDASGSESVPALTPAARIYGRENSDARIIVRAVADSWVEVRDESTNELLLTRVLFKGDSYRVPNRPGLIMLTGNAGGLKISVDGQAVPAVGPLGAVRRDIVLEPDRLASSAEPAVAAPETAPSAAPDPAAAPAVPPAAPAQSE